MKTSELIKKLQESIEKYGDKDACLNGGYGGGYEAILDVVPEYGWKEEGIEDKEAKVAFIGLLSY